MVLLKDFGANIFHLLLDIDVVEVSYYIELVFHDMESEVMTMTLKMNFSLSIRSIR